MNDHTLPLFSMQTKEIPLTRGLVAIVDATDYDFLMQWKWRALWNGRKWYAISQMRLLGKPVTLYMHRVILSASGSQVVDHIDGNGLNNTRANIRLATPQQNLFNTQKSRVNTSGFKGVSWHVEGRRWRASIQVNRKTKVLGYFAVAEDAARAYDEAAREKFGEFANTNFE